MVFDDDALIMFGILKKHKKNREAPNVEFSTSLTVEVAGIEPASLSGEPGILRAQPIWRVTWFLRSDQHVADKPSHSKVPTSPCNAG